MTTAPAPVILRDDTLLDQAVAYIGASSVGRFCDERLSNSPFLCTREPHEDETHVAHDASGRAFAVWPLEGYALMRTVRR